MPAGGEQALRYRGNRPPMTNGDKHAKKRQELGVTRRGEGVVMKKAVEPRGRLLCSSDMEVES